MLACVLLYFGGSGALANYCIATELPTSMITHAGPLAHPGFLGMGREKTVGEITNPFAVVIAMGSLILVLSLCGLTGACCAKR